MKNDFDFDEIEKNSTDSRLDTSLRSIIIEDDFNLETKISFMFYDGINFGGSIRDYNMYQGYANGDTYQRIFDRKDNKIVKVTIKFYDKQLNISSYCEKELDGEVVYKKDDSSNVEIITKEEYDKFADSFRRKNNKSINDI